MSRRTVLAISLLIGIAAGLAGAAIPHAIRYHGVGLGDIGLPVIGMHAFREGRSPYTLQLRGVPAPLYPFVSMLLLSPLTLVPVRLVVPLFLALSSFALAFGTLRTGEPWRLLIFLSPSYLAALESVQWSPLITAALLLPPLLPIAVLAKPQLTIVALAGGRWSLRLFAATAILVLISVVVWPAWPVEWLSHGNLNTFVGRIPIAVLPGFLLVAAAIAWRLRSARILLAMSITMQRYFYDQLPLYLIPKTWRQMALLLITSWTAVGICFWQRWAEIGGGSQDPHVWTLLILGTFLPALGIVLLQHSRSSASPEVQEEQHQRGDGHQQQGDLHP